MPASSTSLTSVRRLSLWSIVMLFAVATVSVPTMIHFRRQAKMPKSLAELAQRIQDKHPQWHIVPASFTGDLDQGFWVCRENRAQHELLLLHRRESRAAQWTGVVLVHRETVLSVGPSEHVFRQGNITLFGDKEILLQLAPLLSGG